MSEPNEIVEESQTDKEINFAKLRDENAALKAQVAELQPLAIEKAIREAGFDPASDRGKALSLAVEAGKVDAEPSKIVDLAEQTFGWKPEPQLNPTEVAQAAAAQTSHAIQTQSGADEPPNVGDQIAEAEAKGDWGTAVNLKLASLFGGGG